MLFDVIAVILLFILLVLSAAVLNLVFRELRERWTLMRWVERLGRFCLAGFTTAAGICLFAPIAGMSSFLLPGAAMAVVSGVGLAIFDLF